MGDMVTSEAGGRTGVRAGDNADGLGLGTLGVDTALLVVPAIGK